MPVCLGGFSACQVWVVHNRMAPQRLKDLIFKAPYNQLRDTHGLTPFVGIALLLSSSRNGSDEARLPLERSSDALAVNGRAFVNGAAAGVTGLPVSLLVEDGVQQPKLCRVGTVTQPASHPVAAIGRRKQRPMLMRVTVSLTLHRMYDAVCLVVLTCW